MPQDIALLEEMCRLTATGVPPGEAARVVLGQQPDTLREEDAAPFRPRGGRGVAG
ncbi:MerR family transcriptional regulator [Streptomyces tanashiensis]